jgi:hypothetical protein
MRAFASYCSAYSTLREHVHVPAACSGCCKVSENLEAKRDVHAFHWQAEKTQHGPQTCWPMHAHNVVGEKGQHGAVAIAALQMQPAIARWFFNI